MSRPDLFIVVGHLDNESGVEAVETDLGEASKIAVKLILEMSEDAITFAEIQHWRFEGSHYIRLYDSAWNITLGIDDVS